MAKYKLTAETIAEDYGEVKNTNPFFKTISDDAFMGYITAALLRDNPNSRMNVFEIFELVKKALKK
jgi:hypothetical protein